MIPINRIYFSKHLFVTLFSTVFLFIFESFSNAQNTQNEGRDDLQLINDFITSKGFGGTISFDSSNIKRFWIDKSVISKDDLIYILLNERNDQARESESFKIQLTNVNETQDCTVSVFTPDKDTSFAVLDTESKVLSESSSDPDFIHYHVFSSTFHLENATEFSFLLKFSSKTSSSIPIKTIVLSFSPNKQSRFIGSPGYDALLKQIDEEGTMVPNSEVKYVISSSTNKMFIKVSDESIRTHHFFYHIYPVHEKDQLPHYKQQGFNNLDSTIKETSFVPKPYQSKSTYTIVQVHLPSYEFTRFILGQYLDHKRLWTLNYIPPSTDNK